MNRRAYYEKLKALARAERDKHGFTTPRVMLADLRRIYGVYGIRIDLWQGNLRHLRGAYLNDECGPTVMVAKSLPREPRIFTMAHELKHHLVDRGLDLWYCDQSNESEPIEIGAEIFAAELIFPEQDFASALQDMGVDLGACTAQTVVHLKDRTQTTLSYASLAKRAEWMGYAATGAFRGVRWKTLEEELLGVPLYKQIRRKRHMRR